MVAEEFLEKVCDFTNQCCIIHAIQDINPSQEGFDMSHLGSLMTLKRIFDRVSLQCQEFICIIMRQRFTDAELQGLQQKRQFKGQNRATQFAKNCTATSLLSHEWLTMDDEGQNMDKNRAKTGRLLNEDDENSDLRVNLRELLNVSTDWKDASNNLGRGGSDNQLSGGGQINLEF